MIDEEFIAESIERERAARDRRRKEDLLFLEEKRKRMFPTPWEKDLNVESYDKERRQRG